MLLFLLHMCVGCVMGAMPMGEILLPDQIYRKAG